MVCNQQNKHSAILQVEDLAVTQAVKIFGLFFLFIQFNGQSSTAKLIFLIHVDVEIAVVYLCTAFQPAGADLCDGLLRQLPITGRCCLRRGIVLIQVRSISTVWKRHSHRSHSIRTYRIRIEDDHDPRLI